MKQKIAIVVALMVAGLLTASAAAPQGNAPPSLQEQLEAQYQLTKINAGTVVPGTVLVTQKEGVFGVPSSSNISPTATYKDGVLHAPGADVLAKCGKDIRPLPKGEKVYVHKIVVNLKEDGVMLSIFECGACTGVMPQPAYKSAVGFQFAKGYLKTASVPDVEDIIAQVFDIYTPPAAPPAAALGQPGQGLTNDDIIKLVQVKLADSIIIAKIKSSTCAFDTGTDALIKLKQAGVSDSVLQAMVEGGGQPMAAPPSQPAPSEVETPPAPACGDYASCLASGTSALSAQQWDQALTNLQKASTLEPTKPEAWTDMGCVYLAIGQQQNAVAMWDKALGVAGAVTFRVWHYEGLHGNPQGTFRLGTKEISFVLEDGAGVFSVVPAEVSSVKSHQPPLVRNAWSFGMKVAGHYHWFFYVPLGVQCENPIKCNDAAGYDQEGAVSNYIAQTIGKLAPGSLGK